MKNFTFIFTDKSVTYGAKSFQSAFDTLLYFHGDDNLIDIIVTDWK